MRRQIIKYAIAFLSALFLVGGTCVPSWKMPPEGMYPGKKKVEPIDDIPLTRITKLQYNALSPDVSPDGEYIAFDCSGIDPNSNRGPFPELPGCVMDFGVKVASSGGSEQYQDVTRGMINGFYPSWFPDGKRILFTGENLGFLALRAISTGGTGGIDKVSAMGTSAFSGDVAPDGSFIVFSAGDLPLPEPTDIILRFYNTEWIKEARIYRQMNWGAVTELGYGADPEISPDGKKIAYATCETGNWDIWIMDVNGDHKKQITDSDNDEISPCWSPDGQWIAYSRSKDRGDVLNSIAWNIWVSESDGGRTVQYTTSGMAHDLYPTWGYVTEGGELREFIFFSSDRENPAKTGFDIYRFDPTNGLI